MKLCERERDPLWPGVRLNATKTIKYGNPFYEDLEFSRPVGPDNMSAEERNLQDIKHFTKTTVIIAGKIDKKYRRLHRAGHAEAFLICRRNKAVVNHAYIGVSGCFKFRIDSPLEGRYDVLVASSHINWDFIASVKGIKGEWRAVCMPEGGVIYWGMADVNYHSVQSGRIVLADIPMDKESGSISEMEKGVGVRLRKNQQRPTDKYKQYWADKCKTQKNS